MTVLSADTIRPTQEALSIQKDGDGTRLDAPLRMSHDDTARTVDESLAILTEALGKATEDLEAAQGVIAGERANAAALDPAASRIVVAAARETIDHLRRADESLRLVVSRLGTREERRP